MLSCGHEETPTGEPLCVHLRENRAPLANYYRCYSGSGQDSALACRACADAGAPAAPELVCGDCFARATRELGCLYGTRGTPEVPARDEPLDPTLIETPIPREIGTVVDMAPVAPSAWLLLTDSDAIVRLDAETGRFARLATLAGTPDEPPSWRHESRRRLHASLDGAFAAVVNDFGRYGQIVDLRSGRPTVALDGDDYQPDTVPFSFCFATVRGRTVAIHRTAWNRLDVTDPATGELLTPRAPTRYERGESRPPHYLDYFHGALHLSPGETHILDDGWIWQPAGAPVLWSLERWLAENVWESEDGPSRKLLCWRDPWNVAMTWLDDARVAVSRVGDGDDEMIDGARIFDLEGRELAWFYGPRGIFFGHGAALFSSDETGLSRWDVNDGARTGRIAGFRPTHHHRVVNELVQRTEGALLRWRVR